MSYEGPYTHYKCGCLKGGNPLEHPDRCPTHDEPWATRISIGKKPVRNLPENDLQHKSYMTGSQNTL